MIALDGRPLLRRACRDLRQEVRRTPATGAEQAVTLAWLGLMTLTTSLREGDGLSTVRPALAVLVLAAWLPLLLRTRWPLLVLAVVVGVESLHVALLPLVADEVDPALYMAAYQPVPLATMLAVWTVVVRTPRRVGWPAAIVAAIVLLSAGLAFQPIDYLVTDIVVLDLVVIAAAAAAWTAARRERTARRADEQDRRVETAVRDERIRIARELHDVLAHHLTLVNAQAGVAEYLLRHDPEGAASALRGITGRTAQAIDELRVTVGLLRVDGADPGDDLRPVPGLRRLPELVEALEQAGTEVSTTDVGVPADLDDHADLAAFRIVQEALTNAARHAPGAPVSVTLDWNRGGLHLQVSNPLTGSLPASAGTGNGVIGMGERARAAGGTLEAGAHGDCFVVRATIPTTEER